MCSVSACLAVCWLVNEKLKYSKKKSTRWIWMVKTSFWDQVTSLLGFLHFRIFFLAIIMNTVVMIDDQSNPFTHQQAVLLYWCCWTLLGTTKSYFSATASWIGLNPTQPVGVVDQYPLIFMGYHRAPFLGPSRFLCIYSQQLSEVIFYIMGWFRFWLLPYYVPFDELITEFLGSSCSL